MSQFVLQRIAHDALFKTWTHFVAENNGNIFDDIYTFKLSNGGSPSFVWLLHSSDWASIFAFVSFSF